MGQILYILTGEIGSGKTRWLESTVEYYEKKGKSVTGVLAPGVWEKKKKVGIDNIIIPEHKKYHLATKKNKGDKGYSKNWNFDMKVMTKVNYCFRDIEIPDYLVVDELGPLELVEGRGLYHAARRIMDLKFKKAIAVVRPHLIDTALIKFSTVPYVKVIDTKTDFSKL